MQLFPGQIKVKVKKWAHSASMPLPLTFALYHTHRHTHTRTHTREARIPLDGARERVSHMWFRLATLSPHTGPKLTTSTLSWSSTCVYLPFSLYCCMIACKSACLYMSLCSVCLCICVWVCVCPSPRQSRVEQWIKVSGPERARETKRGGEGL